MSDSLSYVVAYRELINSDRVSTATREALTVRASRGGSAYQPVAMSVQCFHILSELIARVLPQSDPTRIDLAARMDAQLATGVGDGWRRAELPPDVEAYRMGLLTLADEARRLCAEDFVRLDPDRQDDLIGRLMAGQLGDADGEASDRLTAPRMQAWFEDVRSDAVKHFVAHPDTLACLGYSGIANGGDGESKTGFVRVGIAERESWEPVAPGNVAS